MKFKKLLIIGIIFLGILGLGRAYLYFSAKSKISSDTKIYHRSLNSKIEFFSQAYEAGGLLIKEPDSEIKGGIIPHHLLVKQNIAAFWLGLEKHKYQTIILIGPDHFDKSQNNVILSKAYWQTPYGELEPDFDLINKLTTNQAASQDEYPFHSEHSISGLVSFIKKSQPQANFVPLIVNRKTTREETRKIAQILKDYGQQKDILVVASVDFSHDYPTKIADEHDIISNQTILDFNFNKLHDLDIDSPASIDTLLLYLDLIGAKDGELLFSTNSGRLLNREDKPTTSHNIFYFSK